jgi:hypothetical protein
MKASTMKRLLIALALLSVVLAGCGGQGADPTPKPVKVPLISHQPPPLDAGWTLATIQAEGFAIGLPPGWVKFDLSQGDLDTILASMSQSNPNLASALSGQVASLMAQGIKLYAVDQNSIAGTGFATNLNIAKEPSSDVANLDQLAKQAMDEIKTQFNTSQNITFFKNRADLNSGQAERVMYNLNLNMPNGQPLSVAFTQYLAIYGGNAFILTYTTTNAQSSQYLATFDKSAKTLTFLANQ